MDTYRNYFKIYPDLIPELLTFFKIEGGQRSAGKSIFDFITHYQSIKSLKELPQPRHVSDICEILADYGQILVSSQSGFNGLDTRCVTSPTVPDFKELTPFLNGQAQKMYNSMVYGLKFVYHDYKELVLPVEFTDDNGDITLGSCFLYKGGLVTAKHCIEGAKKIKIHGIDGHELRESSFEIHSNPEIDLLFIRFKDKEREESIWFDSDIEVMDEVITMGYPRIQGFQSFLTGEKANVAARFTASTGQLVAAAEVLWVRETFFLITAKIKGGNSGGPVINSYGKVVGVASNIFEKENQYDDLGYGIVIPIRFVNEIIGAEEHHFLQVKESTFY